MPKFGLFDTFQAKPMQVFHADYMEQEGEYVRIFNRQSNGGDAPDQVGVVRLDKGQYVKQIGI
jgi:hypothetical protein